MLKQLEKDSKITNVAPTKNLMGENDYFNVAPTKNLMDELEPKKNDKNNDINLLFNTVYQLMTEANYKEAINVCNRIIELNPKLIKAWINLGNLNSFLDKDRDAINAYKKAMGINLVEYKEFIKHAISNNLVFVKNGIKALEQTFSKQQNKKDLLEIIGKGYERINNYDKAIEYYDKYLKLDSNNISMLTNKANTLMFLGRDKEALLIYNQILIILPKSENIMTLKSGISFKSVKIKEALKASKKSLLLNPKNKPALFIKVSSMFLLNHSKKDILKVIDEILDIDSNDVDALLLKAVLLESIEKYNDSIIYYDKILKIKPNDINILFSKAHNLFILTQFDKCLNLINKVLELNPKYIQAYLIKADILYNKSRQIGLTGR